MKPYVLVVASIAALAPIQAYANPPQTIRFELTVSAGASKCLPNAHGKVIDHTFGNVENLEVVITGLPPFTDFVIFNIEVPNAPFGLAWYNGDILTDATGTGVTNLVGRFNIGTFIVSQGVPASPPPNVFPKPPAVLPEATVGVKTNPVQIYHLGVWFNDHNDAVKAGCPGTETPFTSNHDAGIQVLNTASFPDNAGPLFNLK